MTLKLWHSEFSGEKAMVVLIFLLAGNIHIKTVAKNFTVVEGKEDFLSCIQQAQSSGWKIVLPSSATPVDE